MSESPSNASDMEDHDCPSHGETKLMSRRISDMIDEAFPLPVFSKTFTYQSSGGSPKDTGLSTRRSVGNMPPPAYTPSENSPLYIPTRYLPDHLARASRMVGPIVSIKYRWVAMVDSQVFSTYSDLMPLAPSMPFTRFLQTLRESITAYVLSGRPGSRLGSGEKILFMPLVKQRTHRTGLLRRRKIVQSALRAENWPAMLAILSTYPQEAKLKVSFWTETPGSTAELLRKQRVDSGRLDIVSFIDSYGSDLCD
ncbi:hypothetical protein CERZMDRAFT_96832 [Cercospora zeae-maydis SCOH1-5]|uniref:Uncharacterized protein n=1 Tax=Cercospora zeae-maydis SCOH1-5 TaxID=717836 RepID=A0A6A6FIC7_9PEZI|nr:hypothetical protein CERZMDRAFT_96832 [Cercospora zeae-maydis SCOH1-5]